MNAVGRLLGDMAWDTGMEAGGAGQRPLSAEQFAPHSWAGLPAGSGAPLESGGGWANQPVHRHPCEIADNSVH